jgi:two-component sensor histidine kinase
MATKSVCTIDGKYLAIARSGACGLLPIPGREQQPSAWDQTYNNATDHKNNNFRNLISQVRARAIYYSSLQQALFCGTSIGLLRFGTDGSYKTITVNGQPFYAREIIGASQAIFLLSARGRLYQWHNNAITELPQAASGQNIRKIMPYGHQVCLIGENNIFLFNPATNQNTLLNVHVPAGSVNDLAWTNDTLWVATDAGLFSVPAPTKQPDDYLPPFYINKILVNNVVYTPQGNLSILGYKGSNISINYSIIAPIINNYIPAYYRMTEGGPWILLPKDSRTLNFQALAPGKYDISFKIGSKVQAPHFAFVIRAPYWQQWWFIVACTALLGIIAGAMYARHMRARVRKLEGQKEKIQLQEDRSRSMLAAIRAQMNPHFFFNALNTIQAYIVTNNKEKATSYLAKFSMLTRTILEMTETETVSLSVEINALQLYLDLEKMRFPSGFEYSINAQAISLPDSIEIPSMIIQPYVENAVKHGLLHKEGEKKLFIDMQEEGDTLTVTIDDNGIGRARSGELNKIKQQKHRSFSTRATEQRLAILNGSRSEKITVTIIDKQNERKQPTGTTVIIKIPVENV